MPREKCPCCGYYTFESYEDALFQICDVCCWQYDEVCHDHPDRITGPNKVSLNVAKKNYLMYGVYSDHMAQHARKPFDIELPENNETSELMDKNKRGNVI